MMSQSVITFMMARASCSAVMLTQPSPRISFCGFQREEMGLQEKMRVYKVVSHMIKNWQ